jgi:hypothetical protein
MGVVGIKTQRAAKLVDGSNSDANGDGNLNDLDSNILIVERCLSENLLFRGIGTDDDDATDMPMPELRFDCTRLMVSSRYFGIEENNARKSCQVASMPGYRLE